MSSLGKNLGSSGNGTLKPNPNILSKPVGTYMQSSSKIGSDPDIVEGFNRYPEIISNPSVSVPNKAISPTISRQIINQTLSLINKLKEFEKKNPNINSTNIIPTLVKETVNNVHTTSKYSNRNKNAMVAANLLRKIENNSNASPNDLKKARQN